LLSQTGNRNTAYNRGNHALEGYLTAEVDPEFTASAAADITTGNISHRNTAYNRGNHALEGYLTSTSLVGYLTGSALTPYVLQSQTGNWNLAYSRGNHRTMGYLT